MTIFASVALLAIIIVTSFISGIFGMAGGMILMGVMAWMLTVQQAMILHGITQLTSNGARACIHRDHINWAVLRFYLIGVAVCLAIFTAFTFVASKLVVFAMLGLLPFLARLVKGRIELDIMKPGHAVSCGFLVTVFQLTAGVSGPVLDVFYLKKGLTRHQVIATKAFTQTLGHLVKLVFFGALVSTPAEAFSGLPAWLYIAVIPAAMIGTAASTKLLDKMDDHQFYKWTQVIVLTIGVVYLARAGWMWISGGA